MNVPQLRFKGFNDEWQSKKIIELGKVLTGNTPSTSHSDFYDENGTLWVTPTDINSSVIINTQKRLSVEGLKHARVVPKNSLLITCIASIGKNAITYQQVAFNQQINALIPSSNNNPYFLLTASYFLSRKMKRLTNAGMMAIFNKTDFSNLKIKIPDLSEQQRIGTLFAKLDHLIELQNHKLELLQELKKGYLQKLFPQAGQTTPQLRFKGFNDEWQTIKLNDIYQKSKEKNTKLNFNQKQVISVANMHFNSDTDAINSTDDYMKTYNVMHRGDIAFEGNKSKKFFGGRFVLNDIGDGIVSHVFEVFSPIVRYDITFMKHYIHNERVMHNILLRSTTKTLMMNTLNSKEFLQQTILLPTLPEQQSIGTLFAKLDNLIALQNHKLELLQELKKGYLQKMFV